MMLPSQQFGVDGRDDQQKQTIASPYHDDAGGDILGVAFRELTSGRDQEYQDDGRDETHNEDRQGVSSPEHDAQRRPKQHQREAREGE